MLDVFPDLFGDKISGVALDRGSSGGDQELLKIPRNVGSFDGRPSDEERIGHQRIRVVAGDTGERGREGVDQKKIRLRSKEKITPIAQKE